MRLDCHQHFWKYDPVRYGWIDDTMRTLRRDFLPEHLSPLLKTHHFDGCIAVQADQTEQETEFLLRCAQQHGFIKGVVGWVDLSANSLVSRLQFYSQNPYFKGVRHIVQSEKEDFVLRPDFQRGISALANFNLTYDLLVFPNQLENSITLVKKFPNQMFILDHIAKPYIKAGEIGAWKKDMAKLAQLPNVYCKLSGMVTEADWINWSAKDFTPYLDIAVTAFGTDRLAFGSDWPVCLLAGSYGAVVDLVENYLKSFPKEEQLKVMGLNACKFYGID